MSSGQKPRTCEYFPRMRDRRVGRALRRLKRATAALNSLSTAASAAVRSVEVMRHELALFGAAVAQVRFATAEPTGDNT